MRLILVSLIFIFFAGIVAAGSSAPITGFAISQPTNISVFINPSFSLSLLNPRNGTYLTNESILLNYTTTGDSVWYTLDNGTTNISITGPIRFNLSQGGYTLYLYSNKSGAVISRNVTFTVNLTLFHVIYEEYKGATKGQSTYFYDYPYEEMLNLGNIILENNLSGKIFFENVTISLPNDANLSDLTLDLDANTNISFNRIELDSVGIPNFNKNATIWFYNLSFTNPRILKDGGLCSSPNCILEEYINGTLKASVNGFSVYSAEETSGVGTTGGGGSGITKGFIVDKDEIRIAISGGKAEEQIKITNIGGSKLDFDLSFSGISFGSLSESKFALNPGEFKTIKLGFDSKNLGPDLYFGSLEIKADGLEKKVLIYLELESEWAVVDSKVEIYENLTEIVAGKNIEFELYVYDSKQTNKTLDAVVKYFIKSIDGQLIYLDEESISFADFYLFNKSLKLPSNMKEQDYLLYVKIEHAGKISVSSDIFKVISFYGELEFPKFFFNYWRLWLIILLLLLLLLLWRRRCKECKREEIGRRLMRIKVNLDGKR